MLTPQEYEELESVRTRIENCIAQEEAHQAEMKAMQDQAGQRLLALCSAQKTVNKFLNSVTVEEVHGSELLKTEEARQKGELQ